MTMVSRHGFLLTLLTLGAVTAASGGAARATSFSASELTYDNALLSQFNLVTLGDYTSTNAATKTVDGRTIVGGNLNTNGGGAGSGGSGFCTGSGCGTSGNSSAVDGSKIGLGALTVFGNVTGQIGAYGNVAVQGTTSGYFRAANQGTLNLKGSASGLTVENPNNINTSQATFAGTTTGTTSGTIKTNVSAASVFPLSSVSAITTELTTLSKGIAALPGSPGVTTQTLPSNNSIFFTANNDYTNGGKKYGVITTTLANLASGTGTGGINNNGNDATFVIVTGDGANYTLPNLNSYAGSNKVIYDFVDAVTLKFAGNWSGSILAPLATITSMGGTIDGSVIVNSINQSQSLYATNLFAGDLSGLVPEPASVAVLGVGIAAAAAIRRRRR